MFKKFHILENIGGTFDIYNTNNLNEEFKTTVYIDIPLESDTESIYNGSVTLKKELNNMFYRYK